MMPDMQHVQAAQHRTRRTRWGPRLAVAALVAALSMALAAPALAAEPPTVTKVEPHSGPAGGGTSVTITGTHFTGATEVKFGSNNAEFLNSETSITAVSPPGTGTVDVTVTTASGGTSPTSSADRFTYVPLVRSISPRNGPAEGGTSVNIGGEGFTGATAVTFGATSVKSFTVNSDISITAVSPSGEGTVDVTVTNGGGTSPTSEADRFYYEAPLRGRYKKENVFLAEGSAGKTFVQGWGTLKIQGLLSAFAYTCRHAEGGYIENPVGGGAGVGATELYSSYQCTFTPCSTFPSVLAEELPWPEVLVEPKAGEIRAKITGIKQDYQCWETKAAREKAARGEGGTPNAKNVFIGVQTPKPENGTSAAHPGFLEFGPAAGRLEQEFSQGTVLGETEGKVKVLGYKEQELISVE
jgi:hypothetical protein